MLQNWITPQFGWALVPDIFVVDVPLSDPDAVEFISSGFFEAPILGPKKIIPALSMLVGEGLRCALMVAVGIARSFGLQPLAFGPG